MNQVSMHSPSLSSFTHLLLALPMVAAWMCNGYVSAQCATNWLPGDGFAGTNGNVYAAVNWDPDGAGPLPEHLVIAGTFTMAGTTLATNIAAFNPNSGAWSAFGSGIGLPHFGQHVSALAVLPNGDLVAGGYFTTAGGASANSIARWNGTGWSTLGLGINGTVYALETMANGNLAAAGAIAAAGGITANNIAQWNGISWSTFGVGINASVYSLTTAANGNLVAGGDFTAAGGINAGRIAQWNGATWSPLGAGTGWSVWSLVTLPNGDVVAGGDGGGVARWNGSSWSSIGPGMTGTTPTVRVSAVAVLPSGNVVAGGMFTSAGGTNVNNIAQWDGSSWSPMGSGINNFVSVLHVMPSGELCVGGGLLSAGGLSVRGVALWNGVWGMLGPGTSLQDPLEKMVVLPNGDLVAASNAASGVGRVVCRNSAAWSMLGAGLANGPVYDLLPLPNGDIVVGGGFTNIGGVNANRVARWNGSTWAPVGSGPNDTVYALALASNGDIVAGGRFGGAGGVIMNRVARWNGSAWMPMASGIFGGFSSASVFALATLPNGDIVAGGDFQNGVTRWNGSSWSPLGGGLSPSYLGNWKASSLFVMPSGDLVMSGTFGAVGGVTAYNIARWNGSAWSALGAGISGAAEAYTMLPNGDLLVGGSFGLAGGQLASRIARWHGAGWSPMPGVNDVVTALATLPSGDVLAAGAFDTAGTSVSVYFARLSTTCPATATTAGTGCTGSGGLNTLSATTLPWIGSTFRAEASGMPGYAFVLAVTGFSTANLPLSAILPQGQTGCSLLVSPDAIDVMLPQGGVVTTALALPNAPTLVGQVFHQQVVPMEVDLSLSIIALTSSNALTLTIGNF